MVEKKSKLMDQADKLAKEALESASRDKVSLEKLKLASNQAHKTATQLATYVADLEQFVDTVVQVDHKYRPAKKIVAKEKTGTMEAVAVLLISDLHPEETVKSDTISGLNEFNLDIAADRMARLAVSLKWMLDLVTARNTKANNGYKITELLMPLLGDMISNEIHDEMASNNSLTPVEAILFVENLVEGIIKYVLANTNLSIRIPCVSGNHDRTTKRIYISNRERRSYTWLLYNHLVKVFSNEPRVTIEVSTGAMMYTEVYEKRVRWTHGDMIKYNGGVGGLHIPLRKAVDAWNASEPASLTCMGHFHTFTQARDAIVNGSLIGFTPFGRDVVKARFEPAAQVFFLIDRDYGPRFVTPLQVQQTDMPGW